MIAAKLYGLYYYKVVDRPQTEIFREMAKYHGERSDIRDFCHDNSPYLGNYIRPRLVDSPDLNSNSTPSDDGLLFVGQEEEAADGATGDQQIVDVGTADQYPTDITTGDQPLEINEFGSNSNTIRGGDLHVTEQDFEIGYDSPAVVQERRKGKKPQKEQFVLPPVSICNLSDESDSYSDMADAEFGGPEIDEGGPSDANQEGETSEGNPSEVLLKPVKEEPKNKSWWQQREEDRAKKKEAERLKKEKTLRLEEEIKDLR